MDKRKENKSALKIHGGSIPATQHQSRVLSEKGKAGKEYSVDEFVSGILSGNRTILSQAITLVESSLAGTL